MADTHEPDNFDDVEISAARLAGRVRAVRRAVESLASLAVEIAALRSALDALPHPLDRQPKEPNAARDAGLSAWSNGRRWESPPAQPAGESGPVVPPVAAGRHALSVTVSSQRGPVDLIRVVRALRSIPSLVDLDLKHYTTGRAVLAITTNEAPDTLPVRDALLSVFPEGVLGDWVSAREYAAVLAGSIASNAVPEEQAPRRNWAPDASD